MQQTPTGTVTLLFTDLVSSTELLEKLGDDAAEELRRTHFGFVRDAVAANSGQEVKTVGDSLMVAFASALDALGCGVAVQQAVYRHNQQQGKDLQLQMRVGLHVGEPNRDEDDYFGTPVVVARRLCDSAQGGQILTSELVRALVGSRGGYTFREVGELKLKGLTEPVRACEILWEPPADEPADGSADGPAEPLPLPPVLATPERTTFVGREQELAELRQYWERVRAGERQLVLLAGEPGIGKTRLAAEFALAAHAGGASILFGRCEEEPPLAYQPFVEALHHYIATCPINDLRAQVGTNASELASLVPELAQRLPDLPPPAGETQRERYRILDAAGALLAAASKAAPMVLVVDDLHWADKATLQLLKHILRSPEQSRLLVLCTYRDSELTRTHPLSETLADMRRDRGFERISLTGLNEGDVRALVSVRAGQEASPAFIRAIHGQTEGNPFFIEEVLQYLEETGAIYQRDGRWMTDLNISELGIPESIKDVLDRRLLRLSEECNSVLTVASVIGTEFGLDALERASDLSGDRLVELLEEAVAARVVEEVLPLVGHYRFSHGLIHQTLYEELTTTRRVRLHGQTLQYADSNGVMLAYEVLGAAGPYVIALGVSNCPAVRTRSRASAQRWDRIIRRCRLILYDRRGVGFSSAPERGYSLFATVEDLRAVLDAVGVERVMLWGTADGGPLAIAFAANYPDRVAGLLLLGTSAKYAASEDFAFGVDRAVMESFVHREAVDQSRAVSELVAQTRPAGSGAEAIGDVMGRVPPRAWSKVVGGIASADARPLLERVRAPTLIVHDPDNNYFPVGAAHYLHEQIPGSQLEITAEYGAWGLGDSLYEKLDAFLEEAGAPGAPRG